MRIDKRKKMHSVAGEHIVMHQSKDTSDMTTVVGFNQSAHLLYERLLDRDFTVDDAVRILCDEYDVDEATARRDAAEWVASMSEHGMLI